MNKQRLHIDQPAVYHIQIQGFLGPHWSESMGGLTISVNEMDEQYITTLSGEVQDQAGLFGILNGLYAMGYALLSVEYQSQSNERRNNYE